MRFFVEEWVTMELENKVLPTITINNTIKDGECHYADTQERLKMHLNRDVPINRLFIAHNKPGRFIEVNLDTYDSLVHNLLSETTNPLASRKR